MRREIPWTPTMPSFDMVSKVNLKPAQLMLSRGEGTVIGEPLAQNPISEFGLKGQVKCLPES